MKLSPEEELKFRKIVDQATNDTKSPLTILLIVAQQCAGLLKEKMFELLDVYASIAPIALYWIDVNNVIVGGNEHILAAVGGASAADYIGKPIYDFYPYEMAESMTQHNNEVMRTGKVLYQRETIQDATSGQTKHFNVFKAPLFDDNGSVVGLVGTLVDVTMEKNAERLTLETKMHQVKIRERRQFEDVLKKMAHDISSSLASLNICLQINQNEVPEKVRVVLFSSIEEVRSAITEVLDQYKRREN
jgi:PAS domain S-box-containing protein